MKQQPLNNQTEVSIAIRSLKSMIKWSDRIGSDEIAELNYVIDLLENHEYNLIAESKFVNNLLKKRS